MKKTLLLLLLLTVISYSEGGITFGGGIGYGVPFEGVSCNYECDWTTEPEFIFTARLAGIAGEDNVLTIGAEYTFRSQKYTIENYDYFNDIFYEYDSQSHNIGISVGMNLNRNPVWWTVGYDTFSKGPYFQSTIGLLAGPKHVNNGLLFALNTYISKEKISAALTLNFHFFGDSYERDEGYEKGGAIAGLITSYGMILTLATVATDGGSSGDSDVESCHPNGCVCKDGTISYAKNKQGACSWHGGIDYEL